MLQKASFFVDHNLSPSPAITSPPKAFHEDRSIYLRVIVKATPDLDVISHYVVYYTCSNYAHAQAVDTRPLFSERRGHEATRELETNSIHGRGQTLLILMKHYIVTARLPCPSTLNRNTSLNKLIIMLTFNMLRPKPHPPHARPQR